MTLEDGNNNPTDMAPYEKPTPKPVPKKKVEIQEPPYEPADSEQELAPSDVQNNNYPSGKLEELMTVCKENKLVSLIVVVAAGTLAYYIVDKYVLRK